MKDRSELIRNAESGDPAVRMQAVQKLREVTEPDRLDAFHCLISVLQNEKDNDIRAYAAGSLGLLRHPFSVLPLMNALNDTFWRVRLTAVWALRELNARNAIPEIIRMCQDTDVSVRALAAKKLGEFNAPEAVETLIQLLNDPEKDVQWEAVLALGHTADIRILEPLKHFIDCCKGKECRSSDGNDIVSEAECTVRLLQENRQFDDRDTPSPDKLSGEQ